MLDGWLTPWWRDTTLAGCCALAAVLLVVDVTKLLIITRYRRVVEKYAENADHAIEMIGEYSRIFKEEGSDLSNKLPNKLEEATKRVLSAMAGGDSGVVASPPGA